MVRLCSRNDASALNVFIKSFFVGGYFGPKENCTVQSASTAAGGLSVGFVSAIPALYRLGLMSDAVTKDVIPLLLWSMAAAYYGLFFAIPLRKYFSKSVYIESLRAV